MCGYAELTFDDNHICGVTGYDCPNAYNTECEIIAEYDDDVEEEL